MYLSDEDHLYFFLAGVRVASAYFVWWNDGYDCLSDYSTKLEPIMGEVHRLAEYWSGSGAFVAYEAFQPLSARGFSSPHPDHLAGR